MIFHFAVFNEAQNFDYYPYFFYHLGVSEVEASNLKNYTDFYNEGFVEPNYDGYAKIHEDINCLLNSIQEVQIGEKKLVEILEYQNISLWQFAKENFSWKLRPHIIAFEYFVQSIEIQKNEIDTVILLRNIDPDISPLIRAYCNAKGISFRSIVISSLKNIVSSVAIKDIDEQRINTGGRKEIRNYIRSRIDRTWDSGSVLMLNMGSVASAEGGKLKDHYLHLFNEYFQKRDIKTYRLLFPSYPKENIKQFIDRNLEVSEDYNNIFFDEFMDDEMWTACDEHINHFEAVWEQCIHSNEFLEAFAWRGLSMVKVLEIFFKEVFTRFIVYRGIGAMWMASHILDHIKPRLVMLTNEAYEYSRAMIIESHRRGITVIGLQHGVIFTQHWYYLDANVSNKPCIHQSAFYGFVAPTYTFVFGEYFKRVLSQKGSYPVESIFVLPNWIMLSKGKNKDTLKRDELLEYFRISGEYLLILSGVFINENLKCIIEKYYNEKYTIVVKLHPNEHYYENIEKLLVQSGKPYVITKEYYTELIRDAVYIYAAEASTSVLDVAMLGRKCYTYGKYKRVEHYPWEDFTYDFDKRYSSDALSTDEISKIEDICVLSESKDELHEALNSVFAMIISDSRHAK